MKPLKQSAPVALSADELLAITFHELRTPISSINGYTSILLSQEMGQLNPEQRQTLKRVQELCQSLTTLTGNLLALAKSGKQKPHATREFVPVGQVGREVIRSLQGEIDRKRMQFLSHFPEKEVRFWGDANDITQIFLNLLTNAVKFTPSEGRVEASVTQEKDRMIIQVADTGVGIPPSERSKIFEEFYHVDHPEIGAPQGSGLGLAIVKRIIHANQGQIALTSRVGKGSRFRVALPIRSERQVLMEFLEEARDRARQMNQWMGLISCQLRALDRKAAPPEGSIDFLEQAFRTNLRKEDRIFRLGPDCLLGVLVTADLRGFQAMAERLERALPEEAVLRKHVVDQQLMWRLISMVAPKRGGKPGMLLKSIQQRLKKAWGDSSSPVAAPTRTG